MDKNNFFDTYQKINGLFVSGSMSKNEYALAHFILYEWNTLRRPSELTLKTKNIVSLLGMSKTTFLRTRNSLKQKQIVDFKIHPGNQSATYFVVSQSTINDTANDTTNVSTRMSELPLNAKTRTSLRESKRKVEIEKRSCKEKKNTQDPKSEDSKLYKFLRSRLGKDAIGILKRSNIPLPFAAWLITAYPVMQKKQPVFYLIALSKREEIVSKWRVLTNERFKESEVKASEFGT